MTVEETVFEKVKIKKSSRLLIAKFLRDETKFAKRQ